MQNKIIDMIEETPQLDTKRCKLISLCIMIFLRFSMYLVGLISWYMYDYFIAISTMVLWFIILGIIRSKLRDIAIPPSQKEYQYSDKDIANWYTAKELCWQ